MQRQRNNAGFTSRRQSPDTSDRLFRPMVTGSVNIDTGWRVCQDNDGGSRSRYEMMCSFSSSGRAPSAIIDDH